MGERCERQLLPADPVLDIARGASGKTISMVGRLVAMWAMNLQNSNAGDPGETVDWLVYRVGCPNKLLGTVIAPTLETALAAPQPSRNSM
jgi:hypothetical protein